MTFKAINKMTPVARGSSFGRIVKGKEKDYLVIRFNDGRRIYSVSIPNGSGDTKKSKTTEKEYVPCYITKSYMTRGI